MKNSIVISMLLVFGLVFFGLITTGANVEKARPNRYESTTADTLAESQSATFTLPDMIRNQVGYFFQVTVVQDSFATDGLAILKASAWDTENRWVPIDTVAFTAAGNYYLTGTSNAAQLQLEIQTDTTNQKIRTFTAANLVETF